MKISYSWLNNYLDLKLPVEEIAALLTDIGLEVEKIEKVESIKGGLKGFVIGEVLTKNPHSNADRLAITTVNIGGDKPLQIVCGAPNVAAGQKVPIATIVNPTSRGGTLILPAIVTAPWTTNSPPSINRANPMMMSGPSPMPSMFASGTSPAHDRLANQ